MAILPIVSKTEYAANFLVTLVLFYPVHVLKVQP